MRALPAQKDWRLGMDIGGTKAHIGLVDESGAVVRDVKLKMVRGENAKDALERISIAAGELLKQESLTFSDLRGIGAGLPGTVDADTGFLHSAPNLGWHGVPCGEILRELTGRRVLLTQDSRAAAFAEYLFGNAKGAKVLVSITLGTGIGCGIVIGGRIFAGGLGAAGESGHINVIPGGRLCGCGQHGCLEAYASGTGIALSANEVPSLLGKSSEEVFALAGRGQAEAERIISEAVAHMGNAMCAIINILSPNAMIFSGGMCTQEALYVRPLIAYIRAHAYQVTARQIKLDISSLGSHAPLVGAAMLDKAQGECHA